MTWLRTLALAPPLLVGLTSACGSLPEPKECTLIGCNDGVEVDFSFRDEGAYVFEVTVDGATTRCEASLPLGQSSSSPCDQSGVTLSLVGSALPPEEQSIGGLMIQSTTAESVTIRATRDGALLGEKTIAVEYTVSPGPNGPDCEPKECKSARLTFP